MISLEQSRIPDSFFDCFLKGSLMRPIDKTDLDGHIEYSRLQCVREIRTVEKPHRILSVVTMNFPGPGSSLNSFSISDMSEEVKL